MKKQTEETLIEDQRPIKKLIFPNGDIYERGLHGIAAIEAYHENGEMASVVWFAVYRDTDMIGCPAYRVNGKYVEVVVYEEST